MKSRIAAWKLELQIRYEWRILREKMLVWVAWHLPKEVVKWCYIRVGAHATTGEYSHTIVPELTMVEGLQRWP